MKDNNFVQECDVEVLYKIISAKEFIYFMPDARSDTRKRLLLYNASEFLNLREIVNINAFKMCMDDFKRIVFELMRFQKLTMK